MMLYGII